MNDARLIAFERLLNIMDELREQCPWDKKQTMESLRHLSIEEVYELSEAILKNDREEIRKELGDVLLHIVFYARIASETNDFTITEVINSLCDKLIVRHPHIYGDVKVKDDEEVKQNWEQIKLKESGGKKRLLSGVPASLASLVKAYRMQEKAAQVGFDWPTKELVWKKVEEELGEFKEAKTPQEREEELGDLLFALVNYARFDGINPDDALEKTNQKFKRRFEYIEAQAELNGRELRNMNLDEMDAWWNEAKTKENKQA
ncbi:MAG: nucleoside triphosphate pyrophosphohydrolase [Bacteroidota bacterium]|nr:nucleoside triphosphate pyrophosphohydrolase [Bacteroidota bacterium]MDX5431657.1 nucleoside triphosphate pyrophosphohydrolase [Bacteroidota bacterium]MDX5470375.1 nucleoside triphosphate pyrophosphohydrolase [Bacteroidota bacterium]